MRTGAWNFTFLLIKLMMEDTSFYFVASWAYSWNLIIRQNLLPSHLRYCMMVDSQCGENLQCGEAYENTCFLWTSKMMSKPSIFLPNVSKS